MKCEGCGQQFDGSQATEIQCYERHEGGRTFSMVICPSCQANRTQVATILAWVVVLFAGITLVALAAIIAVIKLL